MARTNKFNAIRTKVNGIMFDSKMEAERYNQLRLMQSAGMIFNLALQPQFQISLNGIMICKYICDFLYQETPKGRLIAEDVKGRPTPVFRLKWKLATAQYGDRYEFRLWPEQINAKIKKGKFYDNTLPKFNKTMARNRRD